MREIFWCERPTRRWLHPRVHNWRTTWGIHRPFWAKQSLDHALFFCRWGLIFLAAVIILSNYLPKLRGVNSMIIAQHSTARNAWGIQKTKSESLFVARKEFRVHYRYRWRDMGWLREIKFGGIAAEMWTKSSWWLWTSKECVIMRFRTEAKKRIRPVQVEFSKRLVDRRRGIWRHM